MESDKQEEEEWDRKEGGREGQKMRGGE